MSFSQEQADLIRENAALRAQLAAAQRREKEAVDRAEKIDRANKYIAEVCSRAESLAASETAERIRLLARISALGQAAETRGQEVERLNAMLREARGQAEAIGYTTSIASRCTTSAWSDVCEAATNIMFAIDAALATPAATPAPKLKEPEVFSDYVFGEEAATPAPIGKRLREISDAALASGTSVLSVDEIHQRVAESRGADTSAVEHPDTPSRGWPEDASHENGRYQNRCIFCKLIFIGHKRRVVCKLCDAARSAGEPKAE